MEVPLPTAGVLHIQKDTQETAVPHTTVHLQDIEEAHRKVMREVHTEEVQLEAVDTEEAVALHMAVLHTVGIAEAVAHLTAVLLVDIAGVVALLMVALHTAGIAEAVALLMVALLVGIAEAVAHLMAAHQAAVIAVAHTAAVLQVVEDIGEDK